MQPVWLCILSGRRFEKAYDSPQCGKSQTNATNVTFEDALPLWSQNQCLGCPLEQDRSYVLQEVLGDATLQGFQVLCCGARISFFTILSYSWNIELPRAFVGSSYVTFQHVLSNNLYAAAGDLVFWQVFLQNMRSWLWDPPSLRLVRVEMGKWKDGWACYRKFSQKNSVR